MRKHKVNEINLEISDLMPFTNDEYTGFDIAWNSDIGFGHYTIYQSLDTDVWYGDSECMDTNEDKDFIRELMRIFIDKLIIE